MRRNPALGGGSEFPEVDPVTGRIAGARQVNRRTATTGPRAPSSISWSCTASACRPASSAGRGSTPCSRTRCRPTRTHTSPSVAALRVSAHALIRRDGELVQYVRLQPARLARRPLRSGRAAADCNDYSIGIELEGTDATPYTSGQYVVLSRVVSCAVPRVSRASRSSGSSGTATWRPGARPTPGSPSTGRCCARSCVTSSRSRPP